MLIWQMGGGRRAINVVLSSTQTTQQNIRTLAGNPTDIVDVTIWAGYSAPGVTTPGVVLQAGFTLGSGWPSNGSTFKLMNNATIAGPGGFQNGSTGTGGTASSGILSPGQDGQPGGDAIVLTAPITIR